MSKLVVVVSVALLGGFAALEQPGARALFNSANPQQNVGIHYWLQTKDGTRFTERMPVASAGRFTLHIRSNTAGFLGVWTTSDGAMLTPFYEGYPGHRIQGLSEYVVPGDFRLFESESDGCVVVLFARSQTEQVRRAEEARQKLERLHASVLTEFDDSISPSLGTYVVNRDGNQPGAVLPLKR